MNQYLLIKQGNIHNAVEKEAFTADILIENGKIKKIAPVLEGAVINDAEIIDASGIDVYPGFVDAHCHLGLDGYAVEYAGDDFNEIGDAITPELSALDAVNPQDKAFELARAGGVTCVSTGPGSSNVIGGTFCVIKTYGKRIDDMIVKEKSAMKIAFGENPKNCYKSRGIYSRMTIAAKLREVLRQAELYITRDQATPCGENENFITDLIGLRVVDENKEELGKCTDVFQTGANDVYEIELLDGRKVLFPAIPSCILDVDLEKGIMTVHVMAGLID